MTGHSLDALPVLCAVAGVGLLLVACVNLVLEARSSLRGNDREVNFFWQLESLREKATKSTAPLRPKESEKTELAGNQHM